MAHLGYQVRGKGKDLSVVMGERGRGKVGGSIFANMSVLLYTR